MQPKQTANETGVRINVLGVHVNAVNIPDAVRAIGQAVERGERGYVCVTGVHGAIEAQDNPNFKQILNTSLLTVPDGMPLVWFGHARGRPAMNRVYGPDLTLAVARTSLQTGWRHFLYGGNPGVAERLRDTLTADFPGLRIVDTYTPPFRPLNSNERDELKKRVAAAKPDIMWIGLSTPKQEQFMAEYLPQLDTKIMIGVGAAFDILTGRLKDAPGWVKTGGLQWLHRLGQEPRRLFWRYFHSVPRFAFLSVLQLSGLKKYG